MDRSLNMLVFHEVIVLHMKLLLRRKTLSSVGYSSEQEVTPPQKSYCRGTVLHRSYCHAQNVTPTPEVIVMRRKFTVQRNGLEYASGHII